MLFMINEKLIQELQETIRLKSEKTVKLSFIVESIDHSYLINFISDSKDQLISRNYECSGPYITKNKIINDVLVSHKLKKTSSVN